MAPSEPVARRHTREHDLVAATRALFDERGVLDAPIEEIARAVGIARGLIYRHFSSKEELYVLTVTDYLSELDDVLAAALDPEHGPITQLEHWAGAYAGFCLRYPAFLDCALSLMHRPAQELHDIVSESVWLRLGQGIAGCLHRIAALLRDGDARGMFTVSDADYTANVLWTQTLGIMHLARIRVGVREAAPGIPELFTIDPERALATCVENTLASVGAVR